MNADTRRVLNDQLNEQDQLRAKAEELITQADAERTAAINKHCSAFVTLEQARQSIKVLRSLLDTTK